MKVGEDVFRSHSGTVVLFEMLSVMTKDLSFY